MLIPGCPRKLFSLFGIFCLCWTMTHAQEADPISLRVRTDVVLVDLVATDQHGNFITDLSRDEIELLEDGRTQEINFFQFFEPGSQAISTESSAGGKSEEESQGMVSFSSPSQNLSLVFLIDLGSLSHNDVVLVKQSILEFIRKEISPNTRFMIVTSGFGVKVRQTFTSDLGLLETAISGISQNEDPGRLSFSQLLADIENLFVSFGPSRSFSLLMEKARASVGKGVFFLNELANQVQQSTAAIGVLSNHLRSLPGRKHVLFYSAGYHLEAADTIREIIRLRVESDVDGRLEADQRALLSVVLSGLQRKNLHEFLRPAIDQANRSQVSIYSIDGRGLVTASFDPAQPSRRGSRMTVLGQRSRYISADVTHPQDFLVSLSSGSGGQAFLNSNDLSRGVRQALEDARRYYLLSYHPSTPRRPDKFHRIKIKVSRPGVQLRYRTGYLDTVDQDVIRDDVYNALAFPGLFQSFQPRIQTEAIQGGLKITTHVPTGSLSFAGEGDDLVCPVETYGVLVDTKGRWVEDHLLFAKSHRLSLTPERVEELRQIDYINSISEVTAPPGKYQLVVVVRQGRTAQMASVVTAVEVRD